MQRFCYLIVLMALSSSAQAGNSFSFVVAGHRITVEAPRGCNSPSCVSVSIPGIYETRGGRDEDDDIDNGADAAVPGNPPAPRQQQVSTPPIVQPASKPLVKPVASALPAPAPAGVTATAAPDVAATPASKNSAHQHAAAKAVATQTASSDLVAPGDTFRRYGNPESAAGSRPTPYPGFAGDGR